MGGDPDYKSDIVWYKIIYHMIKLDTNKLFGLNHPKCKENIVDITS